VEPAWIAELASDAPDIVAAWNGIEEGVFLSVRREVRRRAGPESVDGLVAQHERLTAAYLDIIGRLPEAAFELPGGEADWTVSETIGHAADARAGLVLAASLAATGRWPADVGPVVPSVAGPSGLGRDALLDRIARSQRLIARSAVRLAGHETDACPLEHPLVGRLRCGEWLLFAGVHDLMHLEQLHRIEADLTEPQPETARPVG
jgi:hypothetical protein